MSIYLEYGVKYLTALIAFVAACGDDLERKAPRETRPATVATEADKQNRAHIDHCHVCNMYEVVECSDLIMYVDDNGYPKRVVVEPADAPGIYINMCGRF